MSLSILGVIGVVVSGVALIYGPITNRIETLGGTRPQNKIQNIHGEGMRLIPDTLQCEDLHLHHPSNTLFTACQVGDPEKRFRWFPPNAVFTDPQAAGEGSIFTVNPKTFTSQKLDLKGFTGPFVTHGIDIWHSESEPDVVYVFVINHLPNPEHGPSSPDRDRPQIEVFKHMIGTTEAEYLRTVRHPLIRTANDLLATGPDSFYVTNDHYYQEGLMRALEDALPGSLVSWSNTVYVQLDSIKVADPTSDVQVKVVLTGLRTNNGLGNLDSVKKSKGEFIIIDAAGGVVHRAQKPFKDRLNNKVKILERMEFNSTLDNPFYFEDPYPEVGGDASGYILPGLHRGFELARTAKMVDGKDPSLCWHLRGNGKNVDKHSAWEKRLIFSDDGKKLRSASGTVMIAIDPKENGGKKQAWLFITGFVSSNMVATKIDL